MRNLNIKRKKLINLKRQEEEQLEKFQKLPETNDNKIKECLGLREKLEVQCQEEQQKYDKAMESLNAETRGYQVNLKYNIKDFNLTVPCIHVIGRKRGQRN